MKGTWDFNPIRIGGWSLLSAGHLAVAPRPVVVLVTPVTLASSFSLSLESLEARELRNHRYPAFGSSDT